MKRRIEEESSIVPGLAAFLLFITLGWTGCTGWYYYRHCWKVPMDDRTPQCALVDFVAK